MEYMITSLRRLVLALHVVSDLSQLQEVFRYSHLNEPVEIVIRQTKTGKQMRNVLKELSARGITKILVHLNETYTRLLLKSVNVSRLQQCVGLT